MKDGGHVFPMLSFREDGGVGQVCEPGMSLRDLFAGQAMQHLPTWITAISTTEAGQPKVDKEAHVNVVHDNAPRLAELAYEMADAMLAERDKKQEPTE